MGKVGNVAAIWPHCKVAHLGNVAVYGSCKQGQFGPGVRTSPASNRMTREIAANPSFLGWVKGGEGKRQ